MLSCFLFLKQMYRYYFSNKHLPILFFFPPNPFIRGYKNKRFIDYKPFREWKISNVEYRKKSQANKKSPSRKLSNAKRNKKGITSCTQFDPVFEYDKYSVLFYSNKKKKEKKTASKIFPEEERTFLDRSSRAPYKWTP